MTINAKNLLTGGRFGQKFQLFVESGTWTAPTNGATVNVIVVGGGDSAGPGARTGGASSFGSLVSASGGAGQEGVGYGTNGYGLFNFGDGGTGDYNDTPNGGDAGEIKIYSGTVTTDQTVTIGAGGLASDDSATDGNDGAVFVWWEELRI